MAENGGRRLKPERREAIHMSDAIEQLRKFIDGRWEEAPDRIPAINPATAGQIAWLPKSDRECARKGIAAAKRAKAAWAAEPLWRRANLRVAIAAKIDERRSEIARTLSAEQGKPLAQATGEVAKAADGFRLAAELANRRGAKPFQRKTRPSC
ncbi:MAG: aldehyde dehydrogenase family protein [Roseiarcus sp.]